MLAVLLTIAAGLAALAVTVTLVALDIALVQRVIGHPHSTAAAAGAVAGALALDTLLVAIVALVVFAIHKKGKL